MREVQRRLNPVMQKVVKIEILTLLEVGVSYPTSDSKWVSLLYVLPEKSGIIMKRDDKNELVSTRIIT